MFSPASSLTPSDPGSLPSSTANISRLIRSWGYEGRGWRGFHHHATLCIAAYAFLIAERARISPSAVGDAADQFATPEISQNRPSRGAARPPRTACCQLDRDDAPTPDRRPRNHPGAMSVL